MEKRNLLDMLQPHRQHIEAFDAMEAILASVFVCRAIVQGAQVDVTLESAPCEPDMLAFCEAALHTAMPQLQVRCRMAFPGVADRWLETFETEQQAWLYRWLSAHMPGQLPFLQHAAWRVEPGRFHLSVGPECAEMLQQQGKDKALEALLRTLLQVDWMLVVENDGTDGVLTAHRTAATQATAQAVQTAVERAAASEPPPWEETPETPIVYKKREPVRKKPKAPMPVPVAGENTASVPPDAPKKADGTFRKRKKIQTEDHANVLYGLYLGDAEPMPLGDIQPEAVIKLAQGDMFAIEWRETKSGKWLMSMNLTDYTTSVCCKAFFDYEEGNELKALLTPGCGLRVAGRCEIDSYANDEPTLMLEAINTCDTLWQGRQDNAPRKRVELHMHTHMSAMDAMMSAEAAVKQAKDWGFPAVAITDHGVVQAFPEAFGAAKGGIKVIYGVECYLQDDSVRVATRPDRKSVV